MQPLKIAILGFGKIAEDQHVPSIAGNPRFELAATSSRTGAGPEPRFTDWRELIRSVEGLEAVAITTPPGPRYDIARECIAAGLHCLLEKPPTTTLAEMEDLAAFAETSGVTIYTAWHSRHNPAVDETARLLAGKRIASMSVRWHENVHKWHPGQQWIWDGGGFGVFDPGINAFSIITRIFPGAVFIRKGELEFPANASTPIAAKLEFGSPAADGPLTCSFDFRWGDDEEWTIDVATADGLELRLERGGSRLFVGGEEQALEGPGEYPDIYRVFADLIDERRSLVDVAPLRLVADALVVASRKQTDPIHV